MKTTTRKQLGALGLSKYQVSVLTKPLTPVGKEGRSSTFTLSQIIDAIRQRLNNTRIKQSTQAALTLTLDLLLARLGNIVSLPQSSHPALKKAGAQLLQSIARTDATLADLQADAMEIQAKYQVAP